jgi:hypothetical protein
VGEDRGTRPRRLFFSFMYVMLSRRRKKETTKQINRQQTGKKERKKKIVISVISRFCPTGSCQERRMEERRKNKASALVAVYHLQERPCCKQSKNNY